MLKFIFKLDLKFSLNTMSDYVQRRIIKWRAHKASNQIRAFLWYHRTSIQTTYTDLGFVLEAWITGLHARAGDEMIIKFKFKPTLIAGGEPIRCWPYAYRSTVRSFLQPMKLEWELFIIDCLMLYTESLDNGSQFNIQATL